MSNVRENLIDRMIRLYGYENNLVIDFAKMCEAWAENNWNNKCLALLVASHEADPVLEED